MTKNSTTKATTAVAERRQEILLDGWGEDRWSQPTVDAGLVLAYHVADDMTDERWAATLDRLDAGFIEMGLAAPGAR